MQLFSAHCHVAASGCQVSWDLTCCAPPLLPADDEEMRQMAQEETEKVRSQMQSLETQLEILLLPKDPLDERSIMLEVWSIPGRHCVQCRSYTPAWC